MYNKKKKDEKRIYMEDFNRMKCPSCGKRIPRTTKCPYCGYVFG